jgi:glycosyltransferase involved in cell wall biosynthesis
MSNKIRAVVLNDTMGPYHYFRLDCADKYLDATAIEFSSMDHTNLWSADNSYKTNVVTLFSEEPITKIPSILIKKKLFKVLNDLNPEVVILSGWDSIPALFALLWALKNNIPTVIISESQEFDFKRNVIKELAKRIILKLIDSAFVGGVNQSDYLIKLGFKKERIFLGCDVVDNDFFFQSNEADNKKIASQLPRCFFMTSCRFVEKKNLFYLIKVFEKFQRKIEGWSLVLVGDGPLKEDLIGLSNQLNISEKIVFTGYQEYESIRSIYKSASCFVLPSITEQWGLVINEALASGIPVLCSERAGCAPNLIENNEVGYTFDPFSEDDLEEKMYQIVEDLKFSNFKSKTNLIISQWGKNKYSNNILKAAEQAIESKVERGFLAGIFLEIFIKIFKQA